MCKIRSRIGYTVLKYILYIRIQILKMSTEMSSLTTVSESDAGYDGLWLLGSRNSNTYLGQMKKHQILKE
jgi:hypothetical protein